MAYTPELSQKHSGTLRLIAWAINKPMTKTIEQVFDLVSKKLSSDKICNACKDDSCCDECVFNANRKERKQCRNTCT